MSNPRKPVRGKLERTKTQNGSSPGDKPAKAKRPDAGKQASKPKTVAAEIGATVMREETANPPPSPPQRPSAPVAAKPAMVKSTPEVPKSVAAKPVVSKPVVSKPVVSKPVVFKPAPAAVKPAPVAAKPAAVVRTPSAAEAPKLPPHLLGGAVDTLERSFKAAGQGTFAVNCKLLDFARANVISSLDHMKDLAAARTPLRVMRLQMEYWHDCLETFASQAKELRALQVDFVTSASEPLRQRMRSTPPKD